MAEYFDSKYAGKIEKLGRLNYLQWANRMQAYFVATGCLRIVLGEEACPPAGGSGRAADTYQTCREKDGKARCALPGSCTSPMAIRIEDLRSSSDMWRALAGVANSTKTETSRSLIRTIEDKSPPPGISEIIETPIRTEEVNLSPLSLSPPSPLSLSSNLWLGHIGHDYVKLLLPNSLKNKQLSKLDSCKTCILSKQTRAPHRKTPAQRATHPFQLIHFDSCTVNMLSLSRSKYYLLFVVDFTRWTVVYFLARKNAETSTQAPNEMLLHIPTQHPTFRIQRFRYDNGTG